MKDNKMNETHHKKKRKKKWIWWGGAAILVLILLVAAIQFTSHSGFCASCHYMKPYFQSWETSSHGEFECSKCHYPPGGGLQSKMRKKIEGLVMVGRYWTKLYVKSKPWAEIRDESCLQSGCHDKRLLEGQVPFNKVVFDHKIHFEDLRRGKQLQCTSCHSQIVQGEHITVTESSCFICHFKKSEFYPQIDECSHCHSQQTLIDENTSRYNHTVVFDSGFACDKCHTNTIIGNGEVHKESCYKCHMEEERLGKFEDTDLMHTSHIAVSKIECNQCHLEIQHKISKDMATVADCSTCHPDFHKAQKILYSGEGGKGVTHAMPNIMLEKGLSCKGCHIFHEEKGSQMEQRGTFVAEAGSCESCHGKGFARILKDWETSTSKKLQQITSIYRRVNQQIIRTKHPEKKKAEELLQAANFNIEIVDKGKGVHNIAFSQELLSASYNLMLEALQTIESSYTPPSFVIATSEVPTQCSNCHAGIEDITANVFGLNFPHNRHLIEQKIDCTVCHSNVREHGEFIATKGSCAKCHHQDPEKDCTSCHLLQKTIYEGGSLDGLEIPGDIMFEAEAACTDCHLNESQQVFRSNRAMCSHCHDEEYQEMFDEWQDSVTELIQTLTTAIRTKKQEGLTGSARKELIRIEQVLGKIQLDGSTGIHNYMFIEETLSELIRQIQEIR